MKKLLLLLTVAGMLAIACEGNGGIEEENGGNPSIPKIELSQQSIEVDFEPNTYTVSVTSPYSWEAVSKNSWIKIETKTGIAGTKELSFTVERNEKEKVREGTIVVINGVYNLATEFYVTQKAISPKITLDKKELNFNVEGGEQSVKIIANFEYEVSTSADWVTYTKTENGITVSVPKYEEVKERAAEITISNEKYGISKTVKVAQCAFEPKLDVTPTDINFTIEGGEQSVEITANVEYEVSTIADWVIYTKTENGITVSASNYAEVKERTAEITISNEKYGISKTVKVSQAGMSEEEYAKRVIFYTSSVNKVITPYRTAAFGVNIVSNTYKNGKGIITFDAPVTSIGYQAFYNRSHLTSVTIPDSVTSIGEDAFDGCSRLTSVTIPDSVTSIGKSAFSHCSSLTSVTIPDSVTSIEGWAFSYCSSLTNVTIGNSVTSIGRAAFSHCSSLTAFYGKYASADKRCLIIDGALNSFAPAGLTSYTIPDSVTSIGANAFYNCSSLRSVTIPDSVTSIGGYAFYGCTGELIINSKIIETDYTYMICPAISNDGWLYGSNFTKLTIGNNITKIGRAAFCGCSSLTAFYGKYASADKRCLIIDGVLNSFAPAGLTSYTIPDSVTSIGEGAFYNCSSLTRVTIPDSVTSIGDAAFYGCSNLESVTIPNGVTSIGRSAFYKCSSLKSVTIPNSVTSIGGTAFSGCSNLTSVYCKPTTPPSGGSQMFYSNAYDRKIYVPRALTYVYRTAPYWSDYASAIVDF